jgi:hypothetical protein
MPFKPGQSGNPKGRPTKDRTIAAKLRELGEQQITLPDGTLKARQELLAENVWSLLLTGRAKLLPSGNGKGKRSSYITLDRGEWVSLLKFLATHVDGPARLDVDVTSDGSEIKVTSITISRPPQDTDGEEASE